MISIYTFDLTFYRKTTGRNSSTTFSVGFGTLLCSSVADQDPYVLGPPDTDSLIRGTVPEPSIYHQAKIVRKTLIHAYHFVLEK
jgi:hypothetical protein